jgi:hypothetical protein
MIFSLRLLIRYYTREGNSANRRHSRRTGMHTKIMTMMTPIAARIHGTNCEAPSRSYFAGGASFFSATGTGALSCESTGMLTASTKKQLKKIASPRADMSIGTRLRRSVCSGWV